MIPLKNQNIILCGVIALIGFLSSATLCATPPGSGWVLTFDDEFNGSGLDTTKWSPRMIWGSGSVSGELEQYNNVLVSGTNKNIILTGSSLRLTAINDNPDGTHPYSSGLVSSYANFNQAFGYFEISAKLCSAPGSWPAFWFLEGSQEASYNWPPEIDVMECPVNSSNTPPKIDYMTLHWSTNKYPLDGGTDSGSTGGDWFYSSQDLSQGFHTYAVDWEPDCLIWYVDGVERTRTTAKVPYLRAMHVILNLAVGNWGGTPDPTKYPAAYEIDYVRAYTKALPSPWAASDIGAPASAGRTYASSSGLFNLYGSGTGITGTSDQCQFCYLPLNGDGTMIARVKNEVGTNSVSVAANPNALAGLMIRETLNANAANVLVALKPVVSGTAGGNVFSSRGVTSGTTATTVLNNNQAVPGWLKLVRSGSTLTGYNSTDGANWTTIGTANINMAAQVYAGFAVTSSGTAQKATAQFDNISVTGITPPVLTSITLSSAYDQMEPGSSSQFSATAYDQFGNALSPQPAFTWSVSGGGSIDSNGLFTSGSSVGGPYTVTAASGAVSGTAPVTIANIPNSPGNLTATAATMLNGWVKLSWVDNSNIETGYSIQYLNATGQFLSKATVGPGASSYTDTGKSMPGGPFTYRVYATGSSGDSRYSNVVTISIPAPPAGPTGLVATPGNNQVALSWSPVSGASNYNIQRATAAAGPYSAIKNNNTGATYTDATAANGTTYYYEVNYNVNGVGSSLYSSPVSAIPVGPLATITVSPATATVQAGSGQQFVAVGKDSFGNNVVPQPAFSWSIAGGGTIDSSGLFSATTVGGPFTVTAASGSVSGTASVTVHAVSVLTTIVVTPASATVLTGSNQQFTATGKDQYGDDMSPQPVFVWSVAGGGSIDSSGLFSTTTVGGPFTVTATGGGISGTAGVTVSLNPIPAAPSGLSSTMATMLNGWYKLAWTDNSVNETGFAIQTLSGTTWTTSGTVGANVTTYSRTGLSMPSGPYSVRVIATGTAGNSTPSNQVTFSLPTPPAGPSGLTAVSGSNRVVLSWNSVGGASNYNVQRATAPAGPYSAIKNNTTSITYTDTTAVNSTTYYYEVNYIVNGVGSSLYCSPVSATPSAQVLTSITVSPSSATVMTGSSQQFTAVALDQSGGNMNPQPTFTWSVSGGGAIGGGGLFTSGTAPGGPYTVTATSGSTSGTASITVGSAFTSWQAGHFTPAQMADASISGPLADPAADGIPNLMKYALNLNPMTLGVSGLPVVGKTAVSESNYLTLSYTQVKAAADIVYTVEVSGDLQTWNSGPAYTAPVSSIDNGATQTIVVQDLVPMNGASRRFIRLRVTLQ